MSSFFHSNNQQQEEHLNSNVNLVQIPKLIVHPGSQSAVSTNFSVNRNNNKRNYFNEKETFIYSSTQTLVNDKQLNQQCNRQQEEIHEIFDFNNNELTTNQQQQQPVYLIFEDDEQHQSQHELLMINNNQQSNWLINNNLTKTSAKQTGKQTNCMVNNQSNKISTSSVIVPALTNVDEIFYLLSQKIAKYCQILSDLTNCEVFYKAQLPLSPNNDNNQNAKPKKYKTQQNASNTKTRQRSLYWGTHQMLFQFSHDQGIKFNKASGDSLIKLNHRSISTDVNQLIEEILNAPSSGLDTKDDSDNSDLIKETINVNKTNVVTSVEEFNLINEINQVQNDLVHHKEKQADSMKEFPQTKENTNDLKLKDCCIYLNRLNDDVTIDDYFNKFETKHNNIESNFMIGRDIIDDENKETNKTLSLNELPTDAELYSDQYTISFSNKKSDETDEDDEEEEDDEKTLLEKNCLNNNNNEINENDENYYKCDQCPSGFSYRHLTQLKIHKLRKHLDVNLDGSCQKCGRNEFQNQEDYLKHSILCYFPNAYQCKTCNQMYDNYGQYLFHIRYIHTHVVYMCAICHRKYKHIKDLIDHDQLMHSKSLNFCELCYESCKTRQCLYDHYKQCHLGSQSHSEEIETINKEHQIEIETEKEGIQKQNNESAITKGFVLTAEQDDEDEYDEEDDDEEENFTKPIKNSKTTTSKVQKNELIRGLIDRKHQCKWCSLRFYTKTQLKQHEQVHTNAVLNCPVCDKQFTSKDRLNGHMKCHMEPSLECKVCGKKFKRLCNLYNHELVHGLTEHAFMLCQFCGRGFRSRRDYQNHVIANHRDHLMKVDADGSLIEELNSNPSTDPVTLSKNARRPRKSSKKPGTSNNYEQQQPETNGPVNDSADDTYFTRTGIHFAHDDLDDFPFDDEDEEDEDDDENEFNNNNKRMRKSSKSINKNKIKKYKTLLMNNQIEVEEDNIVINSPQYTTVQPHNQQINNRITNTTITRPTSGILAHLFEESLS